MATLERIRKKGPLVAIVVGAALLLFVVGDAIRSGQFFFSGEQSEIAKVSGKTLTLPQYEQQVANLQQIYTMQSSRQPDEAMNENIREQAWDRLVQQSIMEQELAKLGIDVSPVELDDLIRGNNMDPMIRQLFTDPNTGQVNRENLTQFIQNIDNPSVLNQMKTEEEKQNWIKNREYWLYLEQQIRERRIMQKYNNLVAKGLYTTKFEAEQDFLERNKSFDVAYVAIKFNTVQDNQVKVSEDEMKEYYKTNKDKYKQEYTRDFMYVPFDIQPSVRDRYEIQSWIDKMKSVFEKTEDDEAFVKANGESGFERKHHKKGDFSNEIDTFIFRPDAKKGDVYGPYQEDEVYKLLKITSIKELADSVKARHIILQPQQNLTMERCKELIDSLKTEILKNPKDTAIFGRLAMQFSMDGSNKKGGDLGWFEEGNMVQEFNDSCFNSPVGKIMTLKTQFGWHLVEVTGVSAKSKKVQVAILDKKLLASAVTRDSIYAKASKFAAESGNPTLFQTNAQKEKLVPRMAAQIKEMDRMIAGLEGSRDIIRWAYKAKKDEISQVYEFGNSFIVGVLVEIREKGIATFEQMKPEITNILIKEKKGEMLKKKIQDAMSGVSSIDQLAQKLSTQVDTAMSVTFASYQIQGAGTEPSVIAAISMTEKGKFTKPIVGENGVFVAYVFNTQEAISGKTDFTNEKMNINQTNQSRASFSAYESLKEKSNVVDKRSKFF